MAEDHCSAFMTPSLTHGLVWQLSHFDTADTAESSGHKSSSKLQRECGDSLEAEISSCRALCGVSHVRKRQQNPKSPQTAQIFWTLYSLDKWEALQESQELRGRAIKNINRPTGQLSSKLFWKGQLWSYQVETQKWLFLCSQRILSQFKENRKKIAAQEENEKKKLPANWRTNIKTAAVKAWTVNGSARSSVRCSPAQFGFFQLQPEIAPTFSEFIIDVGMQRPQKSNCKRPISTKEPV